MGWMGFLCENQQRSKTICQQRLGTHCTLFFLCGMLSSTTNLYIALPAPLATATYQKISKLEQKHMSYVPDSANTCEHSHKLELECSPTPNHQGLLTLDKEHGSVEMARPSGGTIWKIRMKVFRSSELLWGDHLKGSQIMSVISGNALILKDAGMSMSLPNTSGKMKTVYLSQKCCLRNSQNPPKSFGGLSAFLCSSPLLNHFHCMLPQSAILRICNAVESPDMRKREKNIK